MHIDHAVRSWPAAEVGPFDPRRFEDRLRAAMRTLAATGRALDMDTRRLHPWIPRWWNEEPGRAVTFGSDAHTSTRIATNFPEATATLEHFGFRHAAALETQVLDRARHRRLRRHRKRLHLRPATALERMRPAVGATINASRPADLLVELQPDHGRALLGEIRVAYRTPDGFIHTATGDAGMEVDTTARCSDTRGPFTN